jgi:hypothetical protein
MRWLTTLYVAWRDRHDPAWKPTGLKFLTPLHYDETAAVKAARAAKKRTASGRRYASPSKVQSNVVPLRRAK